MVEAKNESTVRRLSRFLANGAIDVRRWYKPIAKEWLGSQWAAVGEIRLIMDGTKIGFGHQLLMVSGLPTSSGSHCLDLDPVCSWAQYGPTAGEAVEVRSQPDSIGCTRFSGWRQRFGSILELTKLIYGDGFTFCAKKATLACGSTSKRLVRNQQLCSKRRTIRLEFKGGFDPARNVSGVGFDLLASR